MPFEEKLKIISYEMNGNTIEHYDKLQLDLNKFRINFEYDNNPFSLLFGENIASELEKKLNTIATQDVKFVIYTNIIFSLIKLAFVYNTNENFLLNQNFATPDQKYSKIIENAILISYMKSSTELQTVNNYLVQILDGNDDTFGYLSQIISETLQIYSDIDSFCSQYIQDQMTWGRLHTLRIVVGEALNSTLALKLKATQIDLKLIELSNKTDDKFVEIEYMQNDIKNNIASSDAKTLTIMSLLLAVVTLIMTASEKYASASDIILVMGFITVLFVIIRITDTFLNSQMVTSNLNKIIMVSNFVMFIILISLLILVFFSKINIQIIHSFIF